MHPFKAEIKLIGINPFVFVPEKILSEIFKKAGKDKGHIPVCGTINGVPYTQTLVRYSGEWRLYVNTVMLKNSPKRIGETIEISIAFDPTPPQTFGSAKAKPGCTANIRPISTIAPKGNHPLHTQFKDRRKHRKEYRKSDWVPKRQ